MLINYKELPLQDQIPSEKELHELPKFARLAFAIKCIAIAYQHLSSWSNSLLTAYEALYQCSELLKRGLTNSVLEPMSRVVATASSALQDRSATSNKELDGNVIAVALFEAVATVRSVLLYENYQTSVNAAQCGIAVAQALGEKITPQIRKNYERLKAALEYNPWDDHTVAPLNFFLNPFDWVSYARTYIATGDVKQLAPALLKCPITNIRLWLANANISQGFAVFGPCNNLISELSTTGWVIEADIIKMLAHRELALSIGSSSNPKDTQKLSPICQGLYELSDNYGYLECRATFADAFGDNANLSARWDVVQHNSLVSAKDYYLMAGDAPEKYLAKSANSWGRLGRALYFQLDLYGAINSYSEAIRVGREAIESAPESYSMLAITEHMNNKASALSDQGRNQEALELHNEILEIRLGFNYDHDLLKKIQLSSTRHNLGVTLGSLGRLDEAHAELLKAVEIRGELNMVAPNLSEADFAASLSMLGKILFEKNDFVLALKIYKEAEHHFSNVIASNPRRHTGKLASVISAMSAAQQAILRGYNDDGGDDFLTFDQKAISIIESMNYEPEILWQQKGQIIASYSRLLTHSLKLGDLEGIWHCLLSMRTSEIKVSVSSPQTTLSYAIDALRAVSESAKKPVSLLIVQTIYTNDLFFAMLDPKGKEPFQAFRSRRFRQIANELLKLISDMFTHKEGIEWNRFCDIAAEAWAALPDPLKESLRSQDEQILLLSCDTNFSMFPFEALKFGSGKDDFLGFHKEISHWPELYPASWSRMRPTIAGNGQRSAALVCAWNALVEYPLDNALQEVMDLAKLLEEVGYKLLPEGKPFLGDEATPKTFRDALSCNATIIHFAGHGSKVGKEPVLMLRPEDGDQNAFMDFGRSDIWHLARVLQRKQLFLNNPFIFLNSCESGAAVDHGGYRIDFVSELIRQGAEAAIATARPASDITSYRATLGFYKDSLSKQQPLSVSLIEARKAVSEYLRDNFPGFQALWSLVSYHGNPFLRLPHVQY